MSEGRCERKHQSGSRGRRRRGEWLDKFENTCCLDAGHEGEHVFNSADDEHLRFDEATQRFGSYRDAPAEGAPALMRFDSADTE